MAHPHPRPWKFQRGLNFVAAAARQEEAGRLSEAHALYIEGIALCFAGINAETDVATKELHHTHLLAVLAKAEALKARVLVSGGRLDSPRTPPMAASATLSPSAPRTPRTGSTASALSSIAAGRKAALRAISLDEEYDRESALAFYEQCMRHFDAARRRMTAPADAPTVASLERDITKYLARAEAITAFFRRSKAALAKCRAEDDEDLLRAIHTGRRAVGAPGTPGAAVPTPPETRSPDFSIAMEAARGAVEADTVRGDYVAAVALYDRACEYLLRAIKVERGAQNRAKWSAIVVSYLERAEELKARVGRTGGGGGGGSSSAPPGDASPAAPDMSELEQRLRQLG